MNATVKEICDNVTLAREMAMLSNYENAEVYYEGSLQMIHQLVMMIPEPLRKSKWQDVSILFRIHCCGTCLCFTGFREGGIRVR